MNTLLEELNVPRKANVALLFAMSHMLWPKVELHVACAPLEHQQRDSTGDITA